MMTNGKKQISIEQLQPGMYVVGMDQSWLRTPFFSHRRLLKDAQDVETLRRCGVQWVTIDTERGQDVASNGHGPSDGSAAQPATNGSGPTEPSTAAPSTQRPAQKPPIFDT